MSILFVAVSTLEQSKNDMEDEMESVKEVYAELQGNFPYFHLSPLSTLHRRSFIWVPSFLQMRNFLRKKQEKMPKIYSKAQKKISST